MIAIVLCVVSAALLNIAFRSQPASISLLLAVVAAAAMILRSPHRRHVNVVVPAAIAVAAALVCVLRLSAWILWPANLTIAASLIIASQDRLGKILTPAGVYIEDLFKVPSWLQPGRLFGNAEASTNRSLLLGVSAAITVVVPLALLLASGDAVFAQLLSSLSGLSLIGHVLVTALLLCPIAALGVAAGRQTKLANGTTGETTDEKPKLFSGAIEGLIVLGSVAVLLTVWGITQVVVFIGGAERFLNTADTTAAEYAHQGFFQLVAAAALVAVVVSISDRVTTRSGSTARIYQLLNIVLGLETIGLIVTTYSRLALYMRGFGVTMLRLSVAWFLAWLAVAMAIVVASVLISGWKPTRTAKLIYLTLGIWVVGFGTFNPEAYIVDRNVEAQAPLGLNQDRSNDTAIDTDYLTSGLGTDAVPRLVAQLDRLDPGEAARVERQLCDRDLARGGFGFFSYNRSAAKATEVVAALNCDRG